MYPLLLGVIVAYGFRLRLPLVMTVSAAVAVALTVATAVLRRRANRTKPEPLLVPVSLRRPRLKKDHGDVRWTALMARFSSKLERQGIGPGPDS